MGLPKVERYEENQESRVKKKKKLAVPIIATPPPYEPQTPVTQEFQRSTYEEVMRHWDDECDRYGYSDEIPHHLVAKTQAVLGAVDLEKTKEAAAKAKQSMLVWILGEWSRGKISGPATIHTLEKQRKKAENLARFLESKQLDQQAAAQWDKAEKLAERILEMEKNT